MKYIISIALTDFQRLIKCICLTELGTEIYSISVRPKYRHNATGVIIKLEEAFGRIDKIYVETKDAKAMTNFKDYLTLLKIN